MASEVAICNLALSHIGDDATVSSISPPDGSSQAAYCARFYPQARDTVLELHEWGFATTRAVLALLTTETSVWRYAYALPSDCINTISVIPNTANNDYSMNAVVAFPQSLIELPVPAAGVYVPQAYALETLTNGTQVIYTNQENAVLRYTRTVTDTTKFPALFVTVVSWYLAHLLSGSIIKGDVGAARSDACLKMAMAFIAQAKDSDTGDTHHETQHIVPWISAR
jgi:hypothetical protein